MKGEKPILAPASPKQAAFLAALGDVDESLEYMISRIDAHTKGVLF